MRKRLKRKKAKAAYIKLQPLFDALNMHGWFFPKDGDKPWRKKLARSLIRR